MKYRLWISLLCLAIIAAPAQVPAQNEGHGAVAGDEEERPPLLSFDPGAAVWTIIVFVVLLIVLRAVAWKPILNGLQQRERFIHDSIEAARHEREEAEKLLKRYAEQLDKARGEASAIVEEGRRDAEALRRTIEAAGKTESDAMIARAKRDIGIARDTAVKELYELSAELATQIAGRIIGKELNAKEHERLVAESIEEVSKLKSNGKH